MPAPTNNRSRRNRQSNPARTNRQAEIAAQVRARQTHEDVHAIAPEPAVADAEAESATNDVVAPRVRSGLHPTQRRTTKRGATRTPGMQSRRLTREQEYTFIKADLRRLLLTAGSLALVMVVLLFVIEM